MSFVLTWLNLPNLLFLKLLVHNESKTLIGYVVEAHQLKTFLVHMNNNSTEFNELLFIATAKMRVETTSKKAEEDYLLSPQFWETHYGVESNI